MDGHSSCYGSLLRNGAHEFSGAGEDARIGDCADRHGGVARGRWVGVKLRRNQQLRDFHRRHIPIRCRSCRKQFRWEHFGNCCSIVIFCLPASEPEHGH